MLFNSIPVARRLTSFGAIAMIALLAAVNTANAATINIDIGSITPPAADPTGCWCYGGSKLYSQFGVSSSAPVCNVAGTQYPGGPLCINEAYAITPIEIYSPTYLTGGSITLGFDPNRFSNVRSIKVTASAICGNYDPVQQAYNWQHENVRVTSDLGTTFTVAEAYKSDITVSAPTGRYLRTVTLQIDQQRPCSSSPVLLVSGMISIETDNNPPDLAVIDLRLNDAQGNPLATNEWGEVEVAPGTQAFADIRVVGTSLTGVPGWTYFWAHDEMGVSYGRIENIYYSNIAAAGPAGYPVRIPITFPADFAGYRFIQAHTAGLPREANTSNNFSDWVFVRALITSPIKLLTSFPDMPNIQVPPYDPNGASVATVQVPLGSRFTLGLESTVTGSTAPVSANFVLTSSSINPTIATREKPLFPNDVLIEFDSSTAGTTKLFQAFHLGSASIQITPSTSSNPPITVNIVVYAPDSLGADGEDLTDLITKYAHLRGIPPQIIKAIIAQESNFTPNAFRYEPGFDNDYIQNTDSLPVAIIDDPSWWPVQLKVDVDDATRQSALSSVDISPREMYYITDPVTSLRRSINSNDIGITATNIAFSNPGNWSAGKLPKKLNFTAQTTVASSYGYMQIMHEVAVEQGWRGPSGARLPSELFLPDENLLAGTRKFKRVVDFSFDDSVPAVGSSSEIDAAFGRAFKSYNGGSDPQYRPEVERRVPQYLPPPTRPIFLN